MKKSRIIRIVLATTVSVAAVTWTAISLSSTPPTPVQTDTYAFSDAETLIYVNEETKQITKYVEGVTGDVLFEENFSKSDTEISQPIYDVEKFYDTTIELEVADGSSAPTFLPLPKLAWSWVPMSIEEQVRLFNEQAMGSELMIGYLGTNSIGTLLRDGMEFHIREGLAETTLPAVEFATTLGSTEIQGNGYSFTCPSQTIVVANEEAILQAAASLPDAQYGEFFIMPAKGSATTVDTTQPCTVKVSESEPKNAKDMWAPDGWTPNPQQG